ncbi:hypothetical protein KR215_010541 [Drosophila sulfurigaster]|nr:hypothetical protein KR215_010541 [Drosophila sulfurigaster]
MNARLTVLLFIFLHLDELYGIPRWDNVMFKTKVLFYKMRGELRTPMPPTDYCQKGLCPPKVTHIACDKPFWGPQCTKPREGVNMEKFKMKLEDLHNNARGRLSSTKWKNLPLAKPLPDIHWDDELSILAMRITNFCNDKVASECVNTPRFLNVAKSSSTSRRARSYPEGVMVHEFRNNWSYAENKYDESFVTSFPANATQKENAFANIVNKRVHRFGCGMLIKQDGNEKIHYFTCLYNEKAKAGQALYDLQ